MLTCDLWRDEDRASGESIAERLESGAAVQPSCGDDGERVSVGLGAPLGTEPAGDFAKDHAGPQGPLAAVVGGGDIATGDEDEEITAAFADTAGELLAGLGSGADGEQPVEPPVEVGTVLGEGGVPELGATAADGNGALQQLGEARSKSGVTAVDGVLGVAQQMGQTELAFVAMPGLCCVSIGHPYIGLGGAEKIGQHCRAAAVGDQVVDGGGGQQHPLPPVFPGDPGRGLVRATTLLRRTSAAVVSAAAVSGVWAR